MERLLVFPQIKKWSEITGFAEDLLFKCVFSCSYERGSGTYSPVIFHIYANDYIKISRRLR